VQIVTSDRQLEELRDEIIVSSAGNDPDHVWVRISPVCNVRRNLAWISSDMS